MLKRWIGVLVAWALVMSGAPAGAQALERFMLRAPTALLAEVLSRHGLVATETMREDVDSIVTVDLPIGRTAADLIAEMEADDDVVGFERDVEVFVGERRAHAGLTQSTAAILEALGSTSPTGYFGNSVARSYASQPAGAILRLATAQEISTGSTVVAVIDTGVDAVHPALRGVVLPGYDFTRNLAGTASDLSDLSQSTAAILEQSTAAILEKKSVVVLSQSTAAILEQSTAAILEGLPQSFGHGTMVAGLVHYVAPSARILPLKAFKADGTSSLCDIIRAIYYAVDSGARVINMSFGVPESSEELMRAVDYATARRAIVVAAAGNQGREMVVFPAAYRPVVAVGSTNNLDQRSAFSNYGIASVSVAAPGEMLVTSYPGAHWAAVSGTSFSAALVSGGVALMVEVYPNTNPPSVQDDLRNGVQSVSGLGAGRINLAGAVARSARRAED